MFSMPSQNTRRKVRLNEKVESRVRGDLYARFGGECLETYHCKKWQGAGCLAYGGQAGNPALGLQTLRGAVPPEIRPLAQRAVLFPHGNEEQVERGFLDGLYPVQDRGQESAEAHRHSGTGDRPGAQLQRGAGDGGEKRRAHGVCCPAVHHTGRQAVGHRAVREGRRQAPDHPGGERRPRGGKTD